MEYIILQEKYYILIKKQEKYTHYQVAVIFGEVLGLPTSHIKPLNNPPPKDVERPKDSSLDLTKTKELGIYYSTYLFFQKLQEFNLINSFKDGLKDVLEPFKKH